MLNIETNTSFVLTFFVLCFLYKSLNYLNSNNQEVDFMDYLFAYTKYICDNYDNIFNYINEVLYSGSVYTYLSINDHESICDQSYNKSCENNTEKKKIKYEDKYLEEIRKMEKEYVLTEIESEFYTNKFNIIYNIIYDSYNIEIKVLKEQIKELKQEISDFECMTELDSLRNSEESNEYNEYNESNESNESNGYNNIKSFNISKNDKINTLNDYIIEKENEIVSVKNKMSDTENIEKTTKKMILDEIIKKRIDKLNGCYVIENTPLGNVLMVYNAERESFTYYSDVTIPYRYLEVVARKYIKFFNCRQIYIDMEEELKLAEQRLQEKKERDDMEKEEKRKESENNNIITETKKSVFTKLKSYNKSSGRVITAAPPKNSIPNRVKLEKETNDKLLLKDNANRYTYEGKLSNFVMLKKIERKIVDKKYGMTFADFKRMQQTKL